MSNQFSGGCSTSDTLVALQVIGDSMLPEFEDGHVVVIDPTGLASHESFVIAQFGEEFELRQLIIEGGTGSRRFYLKTLQTGDREEIPGLDRIKGVVVQRNGRRVNGERNIKHYR